MRVLAFTGLPGSGKTEAVRLAQDEGIPVVRMGQFIMQELERRNLPAEETNIGFVATGMREEHGPDVWAVRTVQALRSGDLDDVPPETRVLIIDGIRSVAEIDRFRAELGEDFTLVAIVADDAVRHGRILDRGRHDDAAEVALVELRDERERGWGIEEAIGAADVTLENNGALDVFRHRVQGVLAELLARA